MIDVRRKISAFLRSLQRSAKELRTNKRKKRAALGCLTLFVLMCVLLEVGFLNVLENFNKTKFLIYARSTYKNWYLKEHKCLPTSLSEFEILAKRNSLDVNRDTSAFTLEYDDLALEAYRTYKPTWTNVKVSADGKRIEGMVHFEGFWVRERYLVMDTHD